MLKDALKCGSLDSVMYLQPKLNFEDVLSELGVGISHLIGEQIMCHCPNPGNHKNGDRNASWGFNTEKMIFNCFVCGGGTILDLIEQQLSVDREKAVAWLIQQANLDPLNNKEFEEEIEKMLQGVTKLPEIMPEYPADSLFQYKKIHPYLYERGISKDVIIEMQVGFDENHYGIVIPHFYGGKLRGMQIRHLAFIDGVYYCPTCIHSYELGKIPKYKSTDHFPASTSLYNYDSVIAEKFNTVIAVESPFSALYLKSHGRRNVVATFGSFNDAQMMQLVRFSKVLLWADNDSAGWKNLMGKSKGKYGKGSPGAIETLDKLTEIKIIPCVSGDKGDPADVPPGELDKYIDSAFYPFEIYLYLQENQRRIPTLEMVQAYTK